MSRYALLLLVGATLTLAPGCPSASAPLKAEPVATPIPQGLPAAERVTLPNGLQVILIPSDAVPYLEIRFVARAGAALDPPGKSGLASLLGRMLLNGSPARDETTIAQTLEGMGARIYPEVTSTSFELAGTAVTFDDAAVQTFLAIFADALRHATLPDAALTREKALRSAAIGRLVDRHDALASAGIDAMLYGDGPHGRPDYGRVPDVESLTRADLVAFRDRVLIPQHGIVAVAGSFRPAAMKQWLLTHLGDPAWGRGVCKTAKTTLPGRCAQLCDAAGACLDNPFAAPSVAPVATPTTADATRQVLHIVRDDPSIATIPWRLGQPNTETLLSSSWPGFRLGTHVLGGGFTSRLNQTLRVKEGLTYGAYFSTSTGGHESGPMRVSTDATPDNLARAIDLALGILQRTRDEPIPDDELESTKSQILNGFAFKFETVSDTLGQYLYLASDNVDLDWLAGYVATLRAVTPADIRAALAPLTPHLMVLVAVGPPSIAEALATYGDVSQVTAEDFVRSGLQTMKRRVPTPAPAPTATGGP